MRNASGALLLPNDRKKKHIPYISVSNAGQRGNEDYLRDGVNL